LVRLSLCITLLAAFTILTSGTAAAQAGPEFKLGFGVLAGLIPDVAGQPVEDEHYATNGDSVQGTTKGLMVWRNADNWTAFTDGALTWVNGPYGLQHRPNSERFDWERTASASESPSHTGGTASLPAAPAAPASTATPAPTVPVPLPNPILRVSGVNVVAGQELEHGTNWIMGELHNDGSQPAYNIKATASLLSSSGDTVGTANQKFDYLGPGDSLGFRMEVRGDLSYEKASVVLDASAGGPSGFLKLPVSWGKNEKLVNGDGDIRYEFTSTVGSGSSQPSTVSGVYVWFLDDQDRVVWADTTYLPGTLQPGESRTVVVKSALDRENPQVPAISQVRYYAVGRTQ